MTVKSIRKIHGRIGVFLAIFIFMQVGTGTIIALNTLLEERPHTHDEYSNIDVHSAADVGNSVTDEPSIIEAIHHHGEPIFQILRIVIGVGILMMAASGATIYSLSQRRKKSAV
jgi:hypothetical protein